MQQPPVVYAVIAAWNAEGCIREALESLRSSLKAVRAVVVDNASTDATRSIIQTAFPETELLSLPENAGFGSASNHGIRHALARGADYILLMNQDAKVDPRTVELLSGILGAQRDVGIISPLHLSSDGTKIDPVFFPFINNHGSLISDCLLQKAGDFYPIEFVNAAVWLVRREVFERVGGFDPIFFMYGEDNDFCARAWFHGFKVCIAPGAVAFHGSTGIPGRDEPFGKSCTRVTSQVMHYLKRPGHVFFFSCLSLPVVWIKRAIVQLMNFEFTNLAVSCIAFIRGYAKLSTIRKHYRQCRVPGRTWLER